MRLLITLLALSAQTQDRLQDVTVSKQRRSMYISRVNALREAEASMSRDPAECVEKCTQIIESQEIEDGQKEVRLRIEHARGGWGEWIPFLPYQLRGRALLTRAEGMSANARSVAVDLVSRAIEDFKKSVFRGARTSAPFLEKAEALLGRLASGDRPAARPETPSVPLAVPPAATPPEDPRTVENILEQIKRLKAEIERLKSKIERLDSPSESPKGEAPKPPEKKKEDK
jgi:hypothetical protein